MDERDDYEDHWQHATIEPGPRPLGPRDVLKQRVIDHGERKMREASTNVLDSDAPIPYRLSTVDELSRAAGSRPDHPRDAAVLGVPDAGCGWAYEIKSFRDAMSDAEQS